MATHAKKLVPAAIGIKKIPTDQLIPNPHNPRMLFDILPLATLKESIDKVGILVPLTVYWGPNQKKWVILDGQRRWICAQELGLSSVPVNQIDEPSTVQNIVTMFQIHKLREDWQLMPTALKLEVLMQELQERNDKKLASLTGLDQAVVTRCKKLLSFPKKYQDMMLDPDPEKRIKADFFIEFYPVLNDRFVQKQTWYNKDRFTGKMLEKYVHGKGAIKAVTDFRTVKQYITNASKARKEKVMSKRLETFTNETTLPVDYLKIEEADISANARKLANSLERITEELTNLDVDEFYGEEQLWRSLERLQKIIRLKLQEAGRRAQE